MAQQERHALVDHLRLDHVIVVQDQDKLVGPAPELVEERRHGALARSRDRVGEQRADALVKAAGAMERGDHVPAEPRRIVVLRIQ